MDKEELSGEGYPVILEFGKFKFIKKISEGGCGEVCLYETQVTRNKQQPEYHPPLVAVKFDPGTENINLREALWLKKFWQ